MSDSTDYNPADNNLGEEPDDPEIGSQGEAELVSEEESFLSPEPGSRWARFWEGVTRAGLGDIVLRLGTHTLLLASILIVAW